MVWQLYINSFFLNNYIQLDILKKEKPTTGLSLRAGGRGFSPATKRVPRGDFYWKIEEK